MNDAANSWHEWIPLALKGDQNAVNQMVNAAQKPLFVFCFHLTKNRQLAEDLTHDALLKSLTSLTQLQNHNSYLPWLKKIARCLFLDYLKSAENAKIHVPFEEMQGEDSLMEDPSISVGQIHALRTLQLLPVEDRAILILIDIQEVSYEEAAEIMDHPIGTIKSKLSRARDKYKRLFEGTNPSHSSSTLRQPEFKKTR